MRRLFLLFLLLVTVTVSAETLPRILTVSSDDLQDVGLSEPIVITFNLPMNQSQVETGIRLEPETLHTFYWIDEQTLAIMPQAEWLQATFYTVTIAADVSAGTDETLGEPYVVQFRTTGILNILSVTPEPDNRQVMVDAVQIAIAFDRPVVPVVTPALQQDLLIPFTISPTIAGEGLWITTSLYVFTPANPLRGGTEYTVTIPAGIETPDGSVLEEPYVWTFRTVNPQTVTITANDMWSDYYVLLDSSFTIEFSQPMEHESTEAAISLQDIGFPDQYRYDESAAKSISGDFEWNDDNTAVTFKPHEHLNLYRELDLQVGTGAMSADGFVTMQEPARQYFATVDFPRIQYSEPHNTRQVAPGMTTFTVYFNTRINNETLENRYTIEPEPASVVTPTFSQNGHFSLRFETEPDVTYTVTFLPGIEDIYGNVITTEFISSFTARERIPDAHLRFANLNYYFSIAGTYLEAPQVAIEASGDFTATFRIYEVDFAELPDEIPLHADSYYGYGISLYQTYDYSTGQYRFQRPDYAVPENIVHEWSVDFGTAPVDHITLTLPDGEPLPMGMYAVELEAPNIEELDGFLLAVGNVGVTVKRSPGDTIVWVTDYETAQPVANVNVLAYQGDKVIPLGQTDSLGIVTVPETIQYEIGATYIVAASEGIYGAWYGGRQANALLDAGAYIYTDRPIYRPGETVYFRGVLRDRDDVTYTVPHTLETITVRVEPHVDYYYEGDAPESEIPSFEVPVSDFGTFSGEFVIPEDTELESLNIYATSCPSSVGSGGCEYGASIRFEVSHFRVPEYEVQATAQDAEIIAGDPLNVLISANYYFGGAVSNANVQWTPYSGCCGYNYFSYQGSERGFSFGVSDDYGSAYAESEEPHQTNGQGQYLITAPVENNTSRPRRMMIEGTVWDESGNTITASTNLLVHPANVYVGLRPNPRFSSVTEPATIDVLTIFPDSTPRPDWNVDITITEIEWVNTSTSFGIYQWERQETEIDTFSIRTDELGRGQFLFDAPAVGTYRIDATSMDDESRVARTNTTLYIIDAEEDSGRTWFDAIYENLKCGFEDEYRRLRLTTDQTNYVPGDTASIFIPNPFGMPATALITVERADIMQQEVIVIDGDALTYELPLTTDFAPTAFVNVTLMTGINNDNPNPRTLRGSISLTIEPVHKRLNIQLTASAESVAPGDEVQFRVRVTDFEGNPVQGEVGLALTDEAVLALRPPNSGTLESAFYGSQGHSVSTYISTWALLNVPGNTSAAGCGGGGGGSPIPNAQLRDDYVYTPLWQPHVITDENGEATVSVTMPDNLTRWRLDARAVTADTSVGQAQMNIISTLPLIVRPVAPRFFVIGDTAEIGAIINNQTTTEQTVNVTLQITGAAVADTLTKIVTIAEGERARVVWLADINSLDGVDFTVYADSGDYQDAAKPSLTNADGVIPVYRFVAQDTAATSGILDSEMSQLEAISVPGRYSHVEGDLTVQLDASIAEITLDALAYLDTYTYQNAEFTVSRFLPKVVTSRALSEFGIQDAELQNDLAASLSENMYLLRRYQNDDGGFGWVRNTQSSPYITAYVVLGLVEAQSAGYTIDVSIVERAVQYLELHVNHNITFNTPDWQLNQQAFLLYVLARSHQYSVTLLTDMDSLYQERVQMSLTGRAYLLMAYQIIGLDDVEIKALADDLLGTAILSATGTHWENTQTDYRSWDSDIRTTAIVLNALIQVRPEHPILPGAVRWLVTARRGDHWESTQETVWATMALNQWMVATGNLKADYSYDVSFNDAVLSRGAMQSPQDSEAIVIDVDDMQAGTINNLLINRNEGTGTLYYSAVLNLQLPANEVPAVSRGVVIERGIFALENEDYVPVDAATVGDIVTVRIAFTLNQDIYFFALQDILPAGLEVINPRLLTASHAGTQPTIERNRDSRFWSWAMWYFDHTELRDTGAEISATYLPRGTYVFSYEARAVTPGEFQASPARAYATYQPEVYGRTSGSLFTVSSAD